MRCVMKQLPISQHHHTSTFFFLLSTIYYHIGNVAKDTENQSSPHCPITLWLDLIICIMHSYVYVMHLQQDCVHRFEICCKLIVGVGSKMGMSGRRIKLLNIYRVCMRVCMGVWVRVVYGCGWVLVVQNLMRTYIEQKSNFESYFQKASIALSLMVFPSNGNS